MRLYRRTPMSSLIVTLVLAAAIAACAAVLTLYLDLVRPHPGFERADRLATLAQSEGVRDRGLPYEALERLTRETTSIEAAAMVDFAGTLIGTEREETLAALVSEGFFDGLRPRLALGAGFRPEDHALEAEAVVVLSYRYWQERFGGRSDVLGTTVEIARNPVGRYMGTGIFPVEPEVDSAQFRIVGVLAESVAEISGLEPAVWTPLQRAWPLFLGVSEALQNFSLHDTYIRIGDGASVTNVLNELNARLMVEDAIFGLEPGYRLVTMQGIVDDVTLGSDARSQLSLFLAAGVLLLLVAAANVGLFLLARAPGRRRELGIRMAVGARVARLARQLASEAGLIVIVAAVPGLIGSIWLGLFLTSFPRLSETNWQQATLLDWRVLGLIAVCLLAVTLLVSLAPMLSLSQLNIAHRSRQTTARASLAQRLAGTVQIIAAGTFGAAAIAFVWYLGSTMYADHGFTLDDRLIAEVVAMPGVRDSAGVLIALSRQREVMESIPGVTAVAFGDPVPGEALGRRTPEPLQLDSGQRLDVSYGTLNREFFDLLGLDLLRGRVPAEGELDGLVINRTLAQSIWGRDDVVGELLPVGGQEILGVIEDVSYYHPAAAVLPWAFRSLGLVSNLWALVETDLTPAQLTQELNRLVAAGALELRDTRVRSLREMRYAAMATDRALAGLTIAAAALVVVLSAFGFYGTQRYLVAAGRREYAIRAALGAGPGALGRLVHRRGLMLGLPGLVLAAILAFIVVEMLRDGFIARTVPSGLVASAVVAGLVLFMLAASIGPAAAARSIEPAALLRDD